MLVPLVPLRRIFCFLDILFSLAAARFSRISAGFMVSHPFSAPSPFHASFIALMYIFLFLLTCSDLDEFHESRVLFTSVFPSDQRLHIAGLP